MCTLGLMNLSKGLKTVDSIDQQILIEIADDLTICKDLYGEIGRKLMIPKEEVLNRLKKMHSIGLVKRIGPLIRHYKTEFCVNAMVVWSIRDEVLNEKCKVLQQNEKVSHVYQRETRNCWPYNLYTMIHGKNVDEIEGLVLHLSSKLSTKNYRILYTKKEWKKTSPDLSYYLGE